MFRARLAAVIQKGQHTQTTVRFSFYPGHKILERENSSRPVFAALLERGVVLRAAFGIRQHSVGVVHAEELFRITGLGIVRMKACCHDPEDTMDSLRIGLAVNLENFVIIRFAVFPDLPRWWL